MWPRQGQLSEISTLLVIVESNIESNSSLLLILG